MASQDPGINIRIDDIPFQADKWLVKKQIAGILHDRLHFSVHGRQGNFDLQPIPNSNLNPTYRSAILTIPIYNVGRQFLDEIFQTPVKVNNQTLRFLACDDAPRHKDVAKLYKTYFVDPKMEEERSKILDELEEIGPLQISEIQFGIFFENHLMGQQRSFSVEWNRKFEQKQATLVIDYDRRRFMVQARQKASVSFYIAISFASLLEIDIGLAYLSNIPYVCFDSSAAPFFAQDVCKPEKNRPRPRKVKQDVDDPKPRCRVGYIDDQHALVAPYAPTLRLQLQGSEDSLQKFIRMCTAARIDEAFIKHHKLTLVIPAYRDLQFFSETKIAELTEQLKSFDWHIAFQLESLIRKGLLHTEDLNLLIPSLRDLTKSTTSTYAGDLLRTYNENLRQNKLRRQLTRLRDDDAIEHPLDCFKRIHRTFIHSDLQGTFRCSHVTVTPTRMVLEGPYVTQDNRVIRQYRAFKDHFIRVDFRDEDLGRYRSDRDVDGTPLLQSRVEGILNEGFSLAGRKFEFLAYSNSSLREHAVWFVNPFRYPDNTGILVDAKYIRASLGKFEGHQLLKTPSKYAARIGQAFTATRDSVEVSEDDWEELEEDLQCGNYSFTDGVGTISKKLASDIWAKLCEGRRDPPPVPSAYLIRFLGYKGVVAIDTELSKTPTKMRLRPSMRKFDVAIEAKRRTPIEISQSFERPNTAYLNRALIMVLEDRKVPIQAFLDLQAQAIEKARHISDSIGNFVKLSTSYHFGSNFHLPDILRRIQAECTPFAQKRFFQLPLIENLCRIATNVILREIRERARIPIEGSYHLVGVADEGPEYVKDSGWKDVFCLQEGEIFACIHKTPDEDPIWLEGPATISRSPITHPGDVQKVHAIGKPPPNQRCLFGHLRNVVVMPSQGRRPLASCLAGGDLDGDQFSIIMHESLLPELDAAPAEYAPSSPWTLKNNETVRPSHISKFIVQYIESDVLGLLSDKLLLVADQSPDGMFDRKCLALSELCSKAVDYPKQGVPVLLDYRSLPRPMTPDWYAGDVDMASNITSNSTYICKSSRALGHLFHEVLRQEKEHRGPHICECDPKCDNVCTSQGARLSRTTQQQTTQHPITPMLQSKIEELLGDATSTSNYQPQSTLIRQLFEHYRVELRYICSMTTMSNISGETLSEEEVVLGSVLGTSLQKSLRKDRQQRMRENVASLVKNVKKHLLPHNSGEEEEHAELLHGLEVAWTAWNFSVTKQAEFGSGSFGLIALATLFYCLDRL